MNATCENCIFAIVENVQLSKRILCNKRKFKNTGDSIGTVNLYLHLNVTDLIHGCEMFLERT